jgi:hypothetical protein
MSWLFFAFGIVFGSMVIAALVYEWWQDYKDL